MALSIGIGIGSRIDVGGHILVVKDLMHPNLIVISVDRGDDMIISDQTSVEILPGVKVFSGIGQGGGGNRLAFEAAKTIRISRLENDRDKS